MPAWLPTLLVIILTALALTESGSSLASARSRRLWTASILLCGSLAIAGTVWQGLGKIDEPAALAGSTSGPETPKRVRSEPTGSDLLQQVKALKDQIRELEEGRQARSISSDTADKLAEYLRQFGNRRVVVSCIPGDIEAYQYANQLVNILKGASWDAQGPELTKIFGDVRTPAINVYVNQIADQSDTAKVLRDGFVKFNIPYQSRVTPNQAIPDNEAVELFIGTKQS